MHETTQPQELSPVPSRPLAPGRVSIYAAVGGLAGVVPLPWIPDALARRIRGALVQDVVDHLGVEISLEARDALADPAGAEGPRHWLGQAGFALGKRVLTRLGPAALLPPARSAFYTFVLGHLFHRYMSERRAEPKERLEVEEARSVRRAINRSLREALRTSVRSDEFAPPKEHDERDAVTRALDALLRNAAGAPGWLVRRLEGGFDKALLNSGTAGPESANAPTAV